MKTALVLACDDNFVPFTAVVARRIARYARDKFPIIVVSDGVSDENKASAQTFCPQISFIEGSSIFKGRDLPVSEEFTRAAHLRLFLDEILADFDHAVYLDSDISPLTDVSPLLTMKPKAAPIIAAHDLHNMVNMSYRDRLQMSGPYFNSGIMVLDIKAIQKERIFAEAVQYALGHPERCLFVDQDPLNVVLDGRWQTLDWRWNAMNYLSEFMPKQPFVRHFAGCKPWSPKKSGVEQRFVNQWRSDLAESPWPQRFQEKAMQYRIRDAFRPTASAVARLIKSTVYSNSSSRRGMRIRLHNQLASTLRSIEQSAAAGAIADQLFIAERLYVIADTRVPREERKRDG